jgi:hypothetical protein
MGPFDASESPGGREPLRRTKLYGGPLPLPSIDFRVWLYEPPTTPDGGRHGFELSQLSSLKANAAAVATKTTAARAATARNAVKRIRRLGIRRLRVADMSGPASEC